MPTAALERHLWVGRAVVLALLLLALLVATSLGVVPVKPARAADGIFTVNSVGDQDDLDFPGGSFDGSSDGKCDVNAGTTGDQCTLRAAIQAANAAPNIGGADSIFFSITGGGPHTIAPASQLPNLTGAVTINGYTEDGASVNVSTTAANDAVLKIELSGANAGAGATGLRVTDTSGLGNTEIRGLVINRFSGDGVVVNGSGATNVEIKGNFIGTDVTGSQDLGNQQGVNILTRGNEIGGTAADAGNVISGNTVRGVVISEIIRNSDIGNKVQGNFIGTNASGTARLSNGDSGVEIFDGSGNTIGGIDADDGAVDGVIKARNVISGNGVEGVEIASGASNRIEGNLIGTSVSGTQDLGNGHHGVLIESSSNVVGGTGAGARNVISGNGGVGDGGAGVAIRGSGASLNSVQGNLIGPDANGAVNLEGNFNGVLVNGASNNTIGGTVPAAANTIAGNEEHGVMVFGDTARGNRILGNSIFGNDLLGIDLFGGTETNGAVTNNDPRDPDKGPNLLQNYPVVTSASTTTITCTLNSRPRKNFTVQLFSNPVPNIPTGFGEGQNFLGQKTVRTNRKGKASLTFTTAVSTGQVITATATDALGNTSEFSRGVAVP